MELLRPATIAGTQLSAGSYTVQWDGTGDQVQLHIFQGKKSVASTNEAGCVETCALRDVVVAPRTEIKESHSQHRELIAVSGQRA